MKYINQHIIKPANKPTNKPAIALLALFVLLSGLVAAPIGPGARKSRGGRWTYFVSPAQVIQHLPLVNALS